METTGDVTRSTVRGGAGTAHRHGWMATGTSVEREEPWMEKSNPKIGAE